MVVDVVIVVVVVPVVLVSVTVEEVAVAVVVVAVVAVVVVVVEVPVTDVVDVPVPVVVDTVVVDDVFDRNLAFSCKELTVHSAFYYMCLQTSSKAKEAPPPAPGLKKNIDKWYQELIEKTVKTSPYHALKFAAIVTYPEPTVLAVYPEDFVPDPKGNSSFVCQYLCYW